MLNLEYIKENKKLIIYDQKINNDFSRPRFHLTKFRSFFIANFLKKRGEYLIMAVFRVEKTRDFTVMSNHHLMPGKK